MECEKRIVIGAEIFRSGLALYGTIEHLTKRDTIDRSFMDCEPYYPTRILIDHEENPVSSKRGGLAAEHIHGP